MGSSKYFFLLVLALLILLPSPAAAFGAGNIASISKIEGRNWRHGDIEDMLKTVACIKGHKWSSMMIKRVYFGTAGAAVHMVEAATATVLMIRPTLDSALSVFARSVPLAGVSHVTALSSAKSTRTDDSQRSLQIKELSIKPRESRETWGKPLVEV